MIKLFTLVVHHYTFFGSYWLILITWRDRVHLWRETITQYNPPNNSRVILLATLRHVIQITITGQLSRFITHPLIFEWFYRLLYVTWYKFSWQLSHNNPRPSRYLSSDCSVEEKHSQHKNVNYSFVLFSMEGNQTSVILSLAMVTLKSWWQVLFLKVQKGY